jgi:mannose/fructose-specific phosphotransferase system component IIA
MRHFLVASHGALSNAILQSAALIAGKKGVNNYIYIAVELNDSREKVRQIVNEALETWRPEDEILVLTDIMGGNVTNILSEYISIRNIHIITGMNLGMVLETLFSDECTPIDELVETIVSMGKMGIKYVNSLTQKSGEVEI